MVRIDKFQRNCNLKKEFYCISDKISILGNAPDAKKILALTCFFICKGYGGLRKIDIKKN